MFLLVLFHVYVGFEHFYAFNYHITMNYILDLCIGFFCLGERNTQFKTGLGFFADCPKQLLPFDQKVASSLIICSHVFFPKVSDLYAFSILITTPYILISDRHMSILTVLGRFYFILRCSARHFMNSTLLEVCFVAVFNRYGSNKTGYSFIVFKIISPNYKKIVFFSAAYFG